MPFAYKPRNEPAAEGPAASRKLPTARAAFEEGGESPQQPRARAIGRKRSKSPRGETRPETGARAPRDRSVSRAGVFAPGAPGPEPASRGGRRLSQGSRRDPGWAVLLGGHPRWVVAVPYLKRRLLRGPLYSPETDSLVRLGSRGVHSSRPPPGRRPRSARRAQPACRKAAAVFRRRRSMGSVGEWRLASAPTSNRGYLPADGRRSAEVGDGGPLVRRLGGTPAALEPGSCLPTAPWVTQTEKTDDAPRRQRGQRRSRPSQPPAAPSTAQRPGRRKTQPGRVTGDHRTSAALKRRRGAGLPGPALRWLSG